jgi:phenylpropionate dioxygenase-like ring-hydroxylating dioxygenase large terminal subunit
MDEAERGLLRGTWLPVARGEDLDEHGVVPGSILDTSLVVYRVDGVNTVADAVCPHRGAALWMGTVRDGALECPYHGWQFAPGTGACTRVPSLPPGSPPVRATLRTYPVREAYGHVWVCLDEPVLPFPELPAAVDATWDLVAGAPIDVACGLRQITENFRDPAHFPFVHAASLGPDVPRVVNPYQVRRRDGGLAWDVTFPTDDGSVVGPLHYTVALPSFSCVLLTSPRDGVRRLISQVAVPTSAHGDRIRLFWFLGHEPVTSGTTVYLSLEERLREEASIFAEDCRIVASMSPAEAPLALDTQLHTRADRFSIAYRQAYRDLLDDVAARSVPRTTASAA